MTNPHAIATGLTWAQREAFRWVDGALWQTAHEMGASGMALTLLCTRSPPLVDRKWNSNFDRYEYRLTPLGLAVRAILSPATPPPAPAA
jgi:hypothetical protein